MKNKINFLLLSLVTILVLYIILKDDFLSVIKELGNLNPIYIIIVLILVLLYYVFRSLSLYNFIHKIKPKIPFFHVLKIIFITQFFDGITPSSTGGQPYQIYALKSENLSLYDATNITIENFIVYQIALIIISLIGVSFNMFDELGNIKHFIILGFLINLFVVITLFSLIFMKDLIKKFLKKFIKKNIDSYIDKFYDSMTSLFSDKKRLLFGIGCNLLSILFLYMVPFFIIYGLGFKINLLVTIITSSYVMMFGTLILIPGGTGGLEYAFIKFYGVFIGTPTLKSAMLLWRFFTYYLGVILGLILFNIRRK